MTLQYHGTDRGAVITYVWLTLRCVGIVDY